MSGLTRDDRVMKRIALIAAALTLAVPGIAEAKQKFKTTRSSGIIKGHFAQPPTSEGYAFSGFLSDSKLGEGAVTTQGTIDGTTTSGGLIAFFDKGTVRGSFTFTLTANPDGTIGLDGTIKFKGGTGAYKGARGSGETTGVQDADGYTTFEYNQKIKLPKKR
jgi:hypothetical protein